MKLDTVLRETQDVVGPTQAALDRGAAALRDRTDTAARRVSAFRGRPRRRVLMLATAVAAAAAVLVVVPTVGFEGGPSSSARADSALRQAASAAGRQSGGWPHTKYWHTVVQVRVNGVVGSNRVWEGHYGPGVFLSTLDDGSPMRERTGRSNFLGIGWDALYRLPTEPAALKSALLAAAVHYGSRSAASELPDMVSDLLTDSPASPALRDAAFQVLAGLPGARDLGRQTDALGRTGTAIQLGIETYLVDTQTGALLETASDTPRVRTAFQGGVTTLPGYHGKRRPVAVEISGGSYRYTYVSAGPASSEPVVGGPLD